MQQAVNGDALAIPEAPRSTMTVPELTLLVEQLETQNAFLWSCLDEANSQTMSEHERVRWAENVARPVGAEGLRRIDLQEQRAKDLDAKLQDAAQMVFEESQAIETK